MTIANNKTSDQALWGKLFAKLPTIEERIYYKITRVSLDEDGLAEINAMHYPTEDKQSVIALDVLDRPDADGNKRFTIVG